MGPDHLEQLRQHKREITRALVQNEEQKRELTRALVEVEEQIHRYELQQNLAHLSPEQRRELWQVIWGGKSGK